MTPRHAASPRSSSTPRPATRRKNLSGIKLGFSNLTGWDFNGQNLANAHLRDSTLTSANLSGADTRGAEGLDLSGATSRNTILPDGKIAGLDLSQSEQLVVRNYHGNPSRWLGPIPIIVQDHMTMASGGGLQILFDADHWDSVVSFRHGIPVILGGTLNLGFYPGVEVGQQIGRNIHLFDWSGVNPTGQFQVESPYSWDISRLYSTGEVTLLGSPKDAFVVGRHLFYNNSKFDGNGTEGDFRDDAAIATDKTALLPGGTATFANYSSFSNGINGIAIDIENLPGDLIASDFEFRVGNSNAPHTWSLLPSEPSIVIRAGAGENGSDRVELLWADGTILKEWLQVTIKANTKTGLTHDDVFYFGSAVGRRVICRRMTGERR